MGGAEGPDDKVLMSRGAPEAPSSRADGTPREVVAGEGTRPAAPDAEAPEAPAGHQEVVSDRSPQAGAIDERNVVLESLGAIKRAGADLIFSYFALDLAEQKVL